MPGVQSQACFSRLFGCQFERLNGCFAVGSITGGIRFGVEFHAIGTGTGCMFHHSGVGSYEERSANAGFLKGFHDVGQFGLVPTSVPPGIGGDLIRSVGNECYLRGLYLEHQLRELLRRIALDVELCMEHRFEVEHVLITDMAFVRTGMHRDALCAEGLTV